MDSTQKRTNGQTRLEDHADLFWQDLIREERPMGSDHGSWNQDPVALDRMPIETARKFIEAERQIRARERRKDISFALFVAALAVVAALLIWRFA